MGDRHLRASSSLTHLVTVCLLGGILSVLGCGPDESPLRQENDGLKKQVAKQESLLTALQDGNKVMQQQIDLLNQELREAKHSTDSAKAEIARMTEQLTAQIAQTKRLGADAQKAAATHAAQQLSVNDKGAQTETLAQPVATVATAVETALAANGYTLKVRWRSDLKAVYVTERKQTMPASLEATGSRNQYLITLSALPDHTTKLAVRADFERVAQGGKLLTVSPEETADVEQRLLGEIRKAIAAPSRT